MLTPRLLVCLPLLARQTDEAGPIRVRQIFPSSWREKPSRG